MNFVHISDSHITLDQPSRLKNLDTTIEFINRYYPTADAVVHTGDIVHNGLPEEYIEALRDRKGLYVPLLSECAGAYTKAHVYWNARRK